MIEEMTIQAIKAAINDREVFIYGVNLEGNGICRLFSHHGIRVCGFIDTRIFDDNKKLGKPVLHPDSFFATASPEKKFIIIGTKFRTYKKLAIKSCEKKGFKKNIDYLISTELCNYMPTIEVSGVCNLRCISCNMGMKEKKKGGFMSLDTYKEVLEKMTSEIPLMNSICLYLWGEPQLNKELPEIIRATAEQGLACDISTNLNFSKHLERVVQAAPDMLSVPCSGIGKNYEMTHTGAKWDRFKNNLYSLRNYIDKHSSDTAVRVIFHMYKHNLSEDFNKVESITKELGFYFFPIIANIFPEQVYHFVINNKDLPEQMKRINGHMIFPLEEQLAWAYEKRHLFCPNMKAFPTVRWDKSVILCCNMEEPTIARNYLETTLTELDTVRENHPFCNACQQHGIHRFFDVNGKVELIDGKRIASR